MNPILPGAIHPDPAGEILEILLLPPGPFRGPARGELDFGFRFTGTV